MNLKRQGCWVTGILALVLLGGCTTTPRLIQAVRAPAPPTPEERTAMQTRTFASSLDTVFAANIAVLQDIGWNIDTADKASGLIKATTNKRQEALSPKEEKITDYELRRKTVESRSEAMNKWTRWEELTLHVEPWGANAVHERVVTVRCGSLPPMSYKTRMREPATKKKQDVFVNAPAQEDRLELQLPEVYQDLFERIQKAVAERQARQGE